MHPFCYMAFFRQQKIEKKVYLDHMSLMCRVQRPFHCLKSIATFSLNFVAIGIPTTGHDGGLAYTLTKNTLLTYLC